MKISPTKVIATLLICLPVVTLADNSVSKTYLARVNQLLETTAPLIAKAQINQDQRSNEHFNYQALQADIQKVQEGIANFINQRQINPNHLAPIKNNYIGNGA